MRYFEEDCAISAQVTPIKLLTTIYNQTSSTLPHWHKCQEILYIAMGSVTITINNHRFYADEHDLVFLNSFDVHALYGEAVVKVIQFEDLNMYDARLNILSIFSMADNLRILRYGSRFASEITSEIITIFHNQSLHEIGYQLNSLGCLFKIISYISLYSPDSDADIETNRKQRYNAHKLQRVLDFIDENYASDIHIDTAAAVMSFSPNYFCTFFKQSMGMTFFEFLNAYRCEKAEYLLQMTDQSITEISYAVGFSSVQYFNRTFKRFRGRVPSAIRKDAKKSPPSNTDS
ncbi:helix-turn-helix domain-containing protein [Agathobaculum sp. NTUH-O15-33]|uniref:helix-turn-helix transcriptional regulator n=1 Tax=Agathobaculum sp. NTUH-O15-33 TaxID=3079302 RepID=UPI00295867F2|nr:helix-turn-helix domain-containing protein [Agathobaculum sp. NTUH-O15-33]WNX83214.1 helix-turn-helix domain-containing protein [Agathobaculum sp. NTUH-O15-33]